MIFGNNLRRYFVSFRLQSYDDVRCRAIPCFSGFYEALEYLDFCIWNKINTYNQVLQVFI